MAFDLVNAFLLLVLLPAWLLVGLADWWCHRISRIEETAGVRESLVHLLLSLQAAAAILPALLFEINALILALMLVLFGAHELTTNLDVRLALPARVFTTIELRLHNFLTAIPFAGMLLVMSTHTEQTAALFGIGVASPDFSLRWKDPALPLGYLIGWITGAFVLNIAPFNEELFRCLRVARKQG